MEILVILGGLVVIGLAALVAGADSRPRVDDEPRRSI